MDMCNSARFEVPLQERCNYTALTTSLPQAQVAIHGRLTNIRSEVAAGSNMAVRSGCPSSIGLPQLDKMMSELQGFSAFTASMELDLDSFPSTVHVEITLSHHFPKCRIWSICPRNQKTLKNHLQPQSQTCTPTFRGLPRHYLFYVHRARPEQSAWAHFQACAGMQHMAVYKLDVTTSMLHRGS
eukprot:364639-Chlamydomonas_euryale.AAC.43